MRHTVLREELSQFLASNGVFRDVLYYRFIAGSDLCGLHI